MNTLVSIVNEDGSGYFNGFHFHKREIVGNSIVLFNKHGYEMANHKGNYYLIPNMYNIRSGYLISNVGEDGFDSIVNAIKKINKKHEK